MANKLDNLISPDEINSRLTPEERKERARKAGIASGEKRRKNRTFKELVELYGKCKISDPKMVAKLKEVGISEEDFTHTMAVVARQYDKAEEEGNTQAATWVRETKEGKLDNKTSVEVTGEVSGITINVKNFSKGEEK